MSDILAKVQLISHYLFDSSGMSSRKQFVFSYLTILGVSTLVGIGVVGASGTNNALRGIGLLTVAWTCIPAIRRCHDLGWSGWRSLLLFVPVAFVVLLLLLAFKKGYVWNPSE